MNSANINITEEARQHIRKQLDMTQAGFLRLGVKESGCNGFMYMLDYLEKPDTDDICVDFPDDVKVCVAESDLAMVTSLSGGTMAT